MPHLTVPVSERDHVQGPAHAAVTLVEYGDFECPHCGRAHSVLEELREERGDEFRLVYRHFPLTQAHPFAEIAAEASEAAGTQGRFWEMHDMLFTHQQALDSPHLVRYAAEIGANATLVAEALAARTFRNRVAEDFMSGVRSGVNGTPTFFLQGVRYDGLVDVESLSAAIKEAAQLRFSR
jgi:protein-disulfide isomerase